MKIGLAQLNTRVGGVDANTAKVLDYAARARDLGCELVLFPELALSGYPPEDLLLHRGLRKRVEAAFEKVLKGVSGIAVYIGYPEYQGEFIYNAGAMLRDGAVLAKHRKSMLPNYGVFDEKRYFQPGMNATVAVLDGRRFGLIICEDAWGPEPSRDAVQAGAEALLVINGSPYHAQQPETREEVLARRARESGVPVIYCNMVGGQDELVFDGGSFALEASGEVAFRAPMFVEDLYVVELETARGALRVKPGNVTPHLERDESVYGALVLGTRDYVEKNGFKGVVLGLSGGVDSALTLAIAVDALGASRVHAVMMPSRFTSTMSLEDAKAQAEGLGVRYDVISIEPLFQTALETLRPVFRALPPDATEENIQARSRGLLLMAVSNKLGEMVLTTGNKSEMAVGYATLYGDMAGGFAPLKDCSKTLVYRLARHRNRVSPAIPERVLTRAPSAELREGQKDTDSLPPYEVLDAVLEAFIEKDYSVEQITELGFDRATVVKILQMVKRAEYKRRQAPPGVRVSSRAFGRDWRYPITSSY
ncbi:MAG TPA: NAD+ synthase [Gammaproteobacteria bacterium]|nr:NAD+ synthase [Gammaproteobacteria bacterium]